MANWQRGVSVLGAILALSVGCGGGKDSGDDGDSGGTGQSGGTGGTTSDPSCPLSLPLDGSSCVASGATCHYGSTTCSCEGGSWECSSSGLGGASASGGFPNLPTGGTPQTQQCPASPPTPDGFCNLSVGICDYPDEGITCECVGDRRGSWVCEDIGTGGRRNTGGASSGGAGGAPVVGEQCPESQPERAHDCSDEATCFYGQVVCACDDFGADTLQWYCQDLSVGGEGGGAAGGAGGASSAVCPAEEPESAARCDEAALQCRYGSVACACDDFGGRRPQWYCMELCPSSAPSSESECPVELSSCVYEQEDLSCECATSDDDTLQWDCEDLTPGPECPDLAPNSGERCDEELECSYDGGAVQCTCGRFIGDRLQWLCADVGQGGAANGGAAGEGGGGPVIVLGGAGGVGGAGVPVGDAGAAGQLVVVVSGGAGGA